MAVPAIDATLEGASANSYVTEAEAVAYLELRPGGKKLLDKDGAERRAALLFAVTLMNRETFWGRRKTDTQSLEFPRSDQSAIPQSVKDAQVEQALDLATGGYLNRLKMIEQQSAGVTNVTTNEIEIRMRGYHQDAFPSFRLSANARQLLQPYVEMGILVGRA